MAFVEGQYEGPSVTRALARHKLKHGEQGEEHGSGGEGQGHEMTISKKPEGGFHTLADGKHHADHATMEQATAHMHAHFGHKGKEKPEQEKPPMMEEPQQEAGGEPNLEAMGVSGG